MKTIKAIRNGRGEITRYIEIEVYWSERCGWVTIPGKEE